MNEEIREAGEVLMLIKKATMFADPIMKLSTIGIAKLIQFCARMAKEKIIDKKDFRDLQDFIKRTDGNFDVINIPVDSKLRLGSDAYPVREFDNLKENGVRFFEMPDLNKEDHFVQIAVSKEDREIFDAWYAKYLNAKMYGGEKNVDSLLAFTERKTSIFSVPFEGNEDVFRTDFDAMKINYTVLPDLKIGDGQVQIMVANCDAEKVKLWYKLYQKDMLQRGEKVPDLNMIDMSTYQNTGKMSTEEYINTGDEKVKEANQKYEKEKSSAPKIALDEGNMTYEDYEENQMYQKFTIDPDTLVNQLDKEAIKSFREEKYFVSRIPGTFGENVQYLVIPGDQVFHSVDSKYYTAFLEKAKKPLMYDKGLKLPIKLERRPFASELYEKHYNLSEREQKATDRSQNKAGKTVENTARKKPVKSPKPPLKAK